jgi:hypothetical protein
MPEGEEEETGAGVAVITADGVADGLPARWLACLIVEGFRTTDHRAVAPMALTWRDLPLPLAAQFSNEYGHDGSVPVGTIETIARDGARIIATGTFHLDNADGTPDEDGRRAAGLCLDGVLRFVSADLEVLDSAYFETEDDWYEEILAGRIGMTTMVMFPAFPQACIVPEGQQLPEPEPYGEAPAPAPVPLIASGVDLAAPPASWFEDPCLSELTHLSVDNDGWVFGHLAGWGIAHRGIQGRSVYAPHSASGYAHFATGTTVCADGTRIATGVLTMGTGHADGRLGLRPAAAHYDDVQYGVADVAVGEDEFGIWLAGAIRGSVSADQLRILRASDVSGDWRPTAAGHELVAALVVNVAGFLVPNSLVASAAYSTVARATFAQFQHAGTEGAILAAGVVRRMDPLEELRREVATLRAAVTPLMPLAAAALDEQMGGAE